jgi:hypothetical protein
VSNDEKSRPEGKMLEVAWLSCLKGEWLLVTGNDKQRIRKWVDREMALQDLSDEGWTIIRSRQEHPRMRFPGVCLRRTIH